MSPRAYRPASRWPVFLVAALLVLAGVIALSLSRSSTSKHGRGRERKPSETGIKGGTSPSVAPGGDGGGGGPPAHTPERLYYLTWEQPAGAAGGRVKVAGLPPAARLDARAHNETKLAAFEAHATQHQHRQTFTSLSLTDAEAFAFAAGVPQPRAVVQDLFEGLREEGLRD